MKKNHEEVHWEERPIKSADVPRWGCIFVFLVFVAVTVAVFLSAFDL